MCSTGTIGVIGRNIPEQDQTTTLLVEGGVLSVSFPLNNHIVLMTLNKDIEYHSNCKIFQKYHGVCYIYLECFSGWLDVNELQFLIHKYRLYKNISLNYSRVLNVLNEREILCNMLMLKHC